MLAFALYVADLNSPIICGMGEYILVSAQVATAFIDELILTCTSDAGSEIVVSSIPDTLLPSLFCSELVTLSSSSD